MALRHAWPAAYLATLAGLVIGAAMLTSLAGCPVPGDGNGNGNAINGNGNEPPPTTFGILNVLSNLAFSDDVEITVFFSVSTDAAEVVALYRLLDGPADSGGQPVGLEEVIATDLSAGLNRSFVFDTTDLRPGFYQLAVQADEDIFFSRGTIEVQGPPEPLFLEPAEDSTVQQGTEVEILADVGDPEGRANWRLFYQASTDPQVQEGRAAGGVLLGTRLTEGTGNAVAYTWDSSNVNTGTYRLGLSATDIGLTIGEAVAADRADAIVTRYTSAVITVQPAATEAQPPTLTLNTNDQTILVGDSVTVSFSAQKFEGPENVFVVTLFYVLQGQEEGTVFATITDPAISSATFNTTGLTPGIYEIGGSIFDGLNPAVEVPADERMLVNVIGPNDVKLAVTAPATDTQVAQGSEVTVEWETNVPPATGRTIRVFAKTCTTCNSTDLGTGSDIAILSGASLSLDSTTWTTTNVTGRHVVFVELTLPASVLATPIRTRAPGVVRVSPVAPQVWVGSLGRGTTTFRSGEVFQGVNFQDNAGTFLNTVNDYDGDGKDEFVIGARYGKPFFQNPSGVGIGEAYFVFGFDRQNRTFNLNRTGTSELPGVVFTGVRPRDVAPDATDGLSAFRQIPDQDGDRLPELMFGFPYVDSRGHTQPLVVLKNPTAQTSLEKPRQFLRGGVVIVGSTNEILSDPTPSLFPDPGASPAQRGAIFLDLVGQNFTFSQVSEQRDGAVGGECDIERPNYLFDRITDDDCLSTSETECIETFFGPWEGFNRDLADSYTSIYRPFSNFIQCTATDCEMFGASIPLTGDPVLASCPTSLGIGGVPSENPASAACGSGFYPLRLCTLNGLVDNAPLGPFGARIIGRNPGTAGNEATTGDKFGSFISVSGGFLLVSAPNRQPVGTEVSGVLAANLPANPGVVYLFNISNLWVDWRDIVPTNGPGGEIISKRIDDAGRGIIAVDSVFLNKPIAPPMPYQYQIDSVDQCGRSFELLERSPSPFIVMGEANQRIQVVEAIPDFNLDGREDFAIGAPTASGGDGALYVAFRRESTLEGDYVLSKISRDPGDVERLTGLRINGRSGRAEGFGEIIARSLTSVDADGNVFSDGIDFNGDGLGDLIVGNPRADGNRGEVIVVFGTTDLITPLNGLSVDALLTAKDSTGKPRAVRIVGAQAGDQLGFNVAVAGDFDGDGINDLLVAAPNGSPSFDSDDNGIPDKPGVDAVNLQNPGAAFGDGIQDDVNGDGLVNNNDNLIGAGLVYLILGSNDLVTLAGTSGTIQITTLGQSTFRGLIFVGRVQNDQLGGGVEAKRGKRSYGIGPAGDVDGDGRDDVLLGSILADPAGRVDAGEAYLVYGFSP